MKAVKTKSSHSKTCASILSKKIFESYIKTLYMISYFQSFWTYFVLIDLGVYNIKMQFEYIYLD